MVARIVRDRVCDLKLIPSVEQAVCLIYNTSILHICLVEEEPEILIFLFENLLISIVVAQ